MFDFFDQLTLGQEIEAHGEEWLSLKYLRNGCHLAVKATDTIPCQVFMVQVKEKKDVEEKGNEHTGNNG